jgi:hypothetical protein
MSRKTGSRTKLVCLIFLLPGIPFMPFCLPLRLLLPHSCSGILVALRAVVTTFTFRFANATSTSFPPLLLYTLGQNLFQSCGLQLVGPPIQSRCAEGTFGEAGCSSGIRQAIPYRLFELKGKRVSTTSEEESISALWYGKWGSSYCQRTAKDSLGLRAKRQHLTFLFVARVLRIHPGFKWSDIRPAFAGFYNFSTSIGIELRMTVDSKQARPVVIV